MTAQKGLRLFLVLAIGVNLSKEIKCTYGGIAIVDDEDYEKVSHLNQNDYSKYPRTFRKENGKLKSETIHRLILESKDGFVIDHIDGDVLNNRKSNLRYCLHKENGRNRKLGKNSTSGAKGVVWYKRDKKYQASIKVDGKHIYLGYFTKKEDAINAYNEASLKYFKNFGRLNKLKD